MMQSTGVVVLEVFHPEIAKRIVAAAPAGWVLHFPNDTSMAEKARILQHADAALVMASQIDEALLDAGPRLKFIQKLGIGVDRIDLPACARRGIVVAKLQATNAIPVAEHALLLMLACLRRLPLNDRRTREGRWEKEEARGINGQLSGKIVGIVGFGAVGRTLARMLCGFGVEVIYYDPFPAPAEVERELKARAAGIEDVIARADILSLHLPLIDATQNIISAERIAAMKAGAILINTARGGLVDEQALAKALDSGHLFAAGIDAFAVEPPVASPLLASEHTVVTPHFAGATIDNFDYVIERAIANVVTVLGGGQLPAGDRVKS
jgi:D-3-phosphoglycerate dehydrogenase